MGASTAYHLAQAGANDVLLIERTAHLEDSATNRCAGGVRYQFATEVNIELSKVSLPMLERFDDEIGVDAQYKSCGYLFLLTNEADVRAFRRTVELQRRLEVDTEWLEPSAVQKLLPEFVIDDILAGTVHWKDGLADPGSVNHGYLKRARELGAAVEMETELTGINVAGGRVVSISTNRGDLACGHVVNAAGPWAGQIGAMVGLDMPVDPIRQQMVTTTPISDLRDDFPFVIDFSQSQ